MKKKSLLFALIASTLFASSLVSCDEESIPTVSSVVQTTTTTNQPSTTATTTSPTENNIPTTTSSTTNVVPTTSNTTNVTPTTSSTTAASSTTTTTTTQTQTPNFEDDELAQSAYNLFLASYPTLTYPEFLTTATKSDYNFNSMNLKKFTYGSFAYYFNTDGNALGKDEYEFDVNNNILTALTQMLYNGNWINYYKLEYTYDTDGKMLSKKESKYENNNWEKQYEVIYINNVSYVTYSLGSTNGIKQKYEYTYDENGNMLAYFFSNYVNEAWVYDSKEEYTYDENGNLLLHITYNYTNDGWVYREKEEYTYDANGIQETSFHYVYNNGEWVLIIK